MVLSGSFFVGFFLFLVTVWLSIITVILLRTRTHYNRLTAGITKRGLGEVLEEIVRREQRLDTRVDVLERLVAGLNRESALHISRIGLVRFNPFSDTGGSQSFTLALLDGKNNGLVMTSLYARTGNRWYVKEIFSGKGKGIELSKEELSAIERAKPFEKSAT